MGGTPAVPFSSPLAQNWERGRGRGRFANLYANWADAPPHATQNQVLNWVSSPISWITKMTITTP